MEKKKRIVVGRENKIEKAENKRRNIREGGGAKGGEPCLASTGTFLASSVKPPVTPVDIC